MMGEIAFSRVGIFIANNEDGDLISYDALNIIKIIYLDMIRDAMVAMMLRNEVECENYIFIYV